MRLDFQVAIIGAACRLPGGGNDLSTLWSMLAEGRDGITDIPPERWSAARFAHPDKRTPGKTYTARAGLIDHLWDFDAAFFGISAGESPFVDPQQRLALELSWEALEDAGIPPSSMTGSKTGVFFGASSMDRVALNTRDTHNVGPRTMTGISLGIIANRISYTLDLHGPSMVVDTACSSSLYALFQACQALAADEPIPLALAGGVNELLTPDAFIGFSKAGMLSAHGRCASFDAAADGYVRGEGGGVVVLKPLDRALADGDRIHAVIRVCGINSDGQTNGISLPSQDAQEALLREIYSGGAVLPENLVFVEAHGTGTSAGDPVEARAIGRVLGQARTTPLPIGSIKTNIGHLEPAAGMAGLMKAILVLRTGHIPRNLHFQTPNPAIDFQNLNLKVVDNLRPLPSVPGRPCVGVNAFAFGGSNAHVVLEAPPARQSQTDPDHGQPPLLLSARSLESLRSLAARHAATMKRTDRDGYGRLVASALWHRDWLRHRLVVSGENPNEVARTLEAFASDGRAGEGCVLGEAVDEFRFPANGPRTAFVFSGNGSQWPGMGVGLMATDPVFASAVSRVAAELDKLGGIDVISEMHRPADQNRMHDTVIAQPLLFAVQVGLVESLRAKGFHPELVYGHSVGEAASLWASGALSLTDACAFIHYRGIHQATTQGLGGMLAANIAVAEGLALSEAWQGRIEVAGDNSPSSITLSGDVDVLTAVHDDLKTRNVFCKLLPLDYPFHSRHMDSLKDALLADLSHIRPGPTLIPFMSTVTGRLEEGPALGPDYLWRNVREPVQFRTATQAALELGVRIFLEIGPHGVLRYYLDEGIRQAGVRGAALTSLQRNGDEPRLLDETWKKAWASGWIPRLEALCPRPAVRTDLPLYPWNRQPARPEISEQCTEDIAALPVHPLLGWRRGDQPVWENILDTALFPVLDQHRVMDRPLFPAAGFIEVAAAAAMQILPDEPLLELRHMFLLQALPLGRDQRREVRVSYHPGDELLHLDSRGHMAGDEWTRNMRCRVRRSSRPAPPNLAWLGSPEKFGRPVIVPDLYETVSQYGFHYGPDFAALESVWRNDEECLARLAVCDQSAHEGMLFSAPLLDAALHLAFIYLHEQPATRGIPFMPVSVDRIVIFAAHPPAWVHFRVARAGREPSGGDITYFDHDGRPLLILESVRLRRTDSVMTGTTTGPGHVERLRPAPHPLADRSFPLPSVEELRRSVPVIDADHERRLAEFRALARAAAVMAAREAMAPLLQDGPVSQDGLAERLELAEGMRPYFFFLLRTLADHHMIQSQDGLWHLLPQTDLPSFADIWTGLLAEFPAQAEGLALLGRIRQRLPGLLRTGPDADLFTALERQGTANPYQARTLPHSPVTAAVMAVLDNMIRHCPTAERLCLLIPSPASAALLETLVPALEGLPCEIIATCADERERDALRSHWSDGHPLSFEIPGTSSTGNGQKQVHCVLAIHSLQAEKELLPRLHACMHRLLPGGILLLAQDEGDAVDDIVFGADPQWWARSTRPDEPVSPLYSADQWSAILAQAGFAEIETLCLLTGGFILQVRKPLAQTRLQLPTRPENQGAWLLLADAQPSNLARQLADALQIRLADADQEVRLVSVGTKPAANTLPLGDDAAWREIWAEAAARGPIRCVSLLGLDDDPEVDADLFSLRLEAQTIGASQAARGWLAAGSPEARMWILTGGFADTGARIVPSQGAAWGLGRVLMNEVPDLRIRLLDLPSDPANGPDLDGLWLDLLAPDEITESVLCSGTRMAPRIEPLDLRPRPALAPGNIPILRLEPGPQHSLEQLEWRPAGLPRPGSGQVLVRTMAAGINFRDIMLSLGLLPDEAFEDGALGRTLGIEFSGVVEKVGPDVTEFACGDQVAGIAAQSLATHVLAQASHVALKPKRLTHAEAATLPTAFCTAWYAMVHLARLTAGESILIHGAAGGVGLAAIQIARHLGLVIHATAGSEPKREFLRLMGADHVHDSRTLAFTDEIRP
jgi:phthiocerol/phenolphthiocerol synthesis type-I polyketide synthase C